LPGSSWPVTKATAEALKAVLRHNRDEEKEHAAMVLEWLRRQDPVLDQQLRHYLFKDGDIMAVEAAVETAEAAEGTDEAEAEASNGCLGIGDLRTEEVAP
jgi:hypothetical protein